MVDSSYILITGASSGMGSATAELLAKYHNLILNGRDSKRLDAVADKCREYGTQILTFPFDLENIRELAPALDALIKSAEVGVRAFLHFAGMTEVLPVARTKYSVGLKVMNVNYFSAAEIISLLLKKKVNGQNLSNIVLVTTIIVNGGKPYQPHYCASKGALTALGMALACELAPRVRVNIIAPGSFKTRIVNTVFADTSEDAPWAPPTLLPPGDVEEVAKVARFLLSPDASYITGQIINVDGGERFPRFY